MPQTLVLLGAVVGDLRRGWPLAEIAVVRKRGVAIALAALKPQERRAIRLKAEGYSYREITELTGWTYTKVNRCLTEGRRALRQLLAEAEA